MADQATAQPAPLGNPSPARAAASTPSTAQPDAGHPSTAQSAQGNPSTEDVVKLFAEIGTAERQFNDLQSSYRRLASLWLLAVFSGSGFVLSDLVTVVVDERLLLLLIFGAGFTGIMLLWSLDLLVYHRLLDGYFLEGLVLERRYHFLPPIRHNMVASQQGVGVLVRVVRFYIIPVILLFLAFAFAACSWMGDPGNLEQLPPLALIEGVLDSLPIAVGDLAIGRTVMLILYIAFVLLVAIGLSQYIYLRTMASEAFFERRLRDLPPPPGF